MYLTPEDRLDFLKTEMQLIQGVLNKYDDMIFKSRYWFITLWTATIGLGITARVPDFIWMASLSAGLFLFLEGMVRHQYWYKYVVRYRAIRDELNNEKGNIENLSLYDLTHHYGNNKPSEGERVWKSFVKVEPLVFYAVLGFVAYGVWQYQVVTAVIALPSSSVTPPHSAFQYGAVINAGSTGSRLAIFKWRIPDSGVPDVQQIASVKDTDLHNKPKCPLTDLKDQPKGGTCDCLVALTDSAKADPSFEKPGLLPIPLWVMATAGVRSRDLHIQEEILEATNQCLESVTGFQLKTAEVISGPKEGFYAWLAVNHSFQTLQTDVVDETYGIVEIGGLSAQLAYRISKPPLSINHGRIFDVSLGSRKFHVYSFSAPLGKELALIERRRDPSSDCDEDKLPNPCVGKRIQPFINKTKHLVELKPSTTMHFAGLGSFNRVVDNMGLMGNSTLKALLDKTTEICGPDKKGATIKMTKRKETFEKVKVPDEFKQDVCFDSFYATQLGNYGWGIELDRISPPKPGTEDWPLGAMIFKAAKSTE